MVLQGAEILCTWLTCLGCCGLQCALCFHKRYCTYIAIPLAVYPTAIGSEPQDPTYDSAGHWERAMCGHSAANLVPVVASNRIGKEIIGTSSITFYGEPNGVLDKKMEPFFTPTTLTSLFLLPIFYQ